MTRQRKKSFNRLLGVCQSPWLRDFRDLEGKLYTGGEVLDPSKVESWYAPQKTGSIKCGQQKERARNASLLARALSGKKNTSLTIHNHWINIHWFVVQIYTLGVPGNPKQRNGSSGPGFSMARPLA